MRPILLLAILLLTGCPKDPVESPPVHDDTGEPPDSGMDDTGAPPVTGFTATTEVLDGSGGTIVLEFTAVEQGAVAQRFTVGAGATFGTDALADGAYGLRAWLDEDGDADNIDDMVALYALRDGEDLYLGLQLAGPVVDAPAGTTWQLWLAPQDGDGDLPATDLGAMLSYRAEPATMPGASAVVELLGSGCLDCADFATSGQSLEARLTLPDLGLDTGPVQLIAVRAASRGEALLPAHGALLSDGDDGTVLVTFEVDAAAVAEGITRRHNHHPERRSRRAGCLGGPRPGAVRRWPRHGRGGRRCRLDHHRRPRGGRQRGLQVPAGRPHRPQLGGRGVPG